MKRLMVKAFAARLISGFLLLILLTPVSVRADDMDFGKLEPEQVKKGAPTLEESKDAPPNVEADGTSTVKIQPSKWSEIKRNFGAGFFQYANADAAEWNHGLGHLSTYNYFSLEYRTGRGEKVFIRPAFLFDTSGLSSRGRSLPQTFEWHDVFVGYATYNMPWLPFNMDYQSELRVYLPTGQLSSNEGVIARVRGDLKAHYPLSSRLTFLLWFKPEYDIQQRTAFQNGRYTNGTRDYSYELSANLFYLFKGGVWGLGGSIQHAQSWAHASVVEKIPVFTREEVQAQVFLGINAYGFLIHVGVDQTRDVARPRTALVAFNDQELQYFARTYYRF